MATFAAFSQDSVLVPINSTTLYTFSAIAVSTYWLRCRACLSPNSFSVRVLALGTHYTHALGLIVQAILLRRFSLVVRPKELVVEKTKICPDCNKAIC